MMDAAIDLHSLDREAAVLASRLDGERTDLATDDGRAAARLSDPFRDLRHLAGQTTYRALLELSPKAEDGPFRDALVRFCHEFLQSRIDRDLRLDEADALHASDPTLALQPIPRTYAEALDGILTADDVVRARIALERASELASPIAAVRKERRMRRREAARRLGLAHSFALASASDLTAAAREFLDASEPLARERLRHLHRGMPAKPSAADAMFAALGREAREGWPARLGDRWLREIFGALTLRSVPVGPLPRPLGGASFLRAAQSFGMALRSSGVARSLPFVLKRDPYPVGAYRFGFAFSCAMADPSFLRRVLGIGARHAGDQARVLRGVIFDAARRLAARYLLAEDSEAFEEITARVFGAPLPAAMRDAWPELRTEEPARLLALFSAFDFVHDLVARFDDDWFRNPRVATHLAAIAAGPVFEPMPASGGATLARAFEEALG